LEARLKVWIEERGQLVLSDYRVRLLEAIGRRGSLADGAAEMGLSYRRAWGKVREIEANLGLRLVASTAGGPGGGESHLTEDGERLVRLYNRFRSALAERAEQEFAAVFERSC
jgi:molybdate transport system regulatory protein